MVNSVNNISIPITDDTNLYTDLRIDSLTFINFLLRVEQHFNITFDIDEMEKCLQVDNLIQLVKIKIKEEVQKL